MFTIILTVGAMDNILHKDEKCSWLDVEGLPSRGVTEGFNWGRHQSIESPGHDS